MTQALAVEDELVLTADEVAEGEVGAVGSRALGEHRHPLAALAAVVGRAGRVGDQRRALLGLGRGGRALDPAVLADRQPDAVAGDVDDHRRLAGNEVALLVEDGVVGQPVLAVDAAHAAVGEHREGVVGVARIAAAGDRLGEADQDGHRRRPRPPTPRPRAGLPRESAASGRGPRPGSPAGRARGRSPARPPRPRARPIHSAILAALPSMSPTVGLIWASATRIGPRDEHRRSIPARKRGRGRDGR